MPYQEYDFVIKVGDTGPPIMVQCLDSNGSPVDLTGATALKFKMRSARSGVVEVNATADFIDRPTGKVQYFWVTTDTDTSGDYQGEFNVTMSNGQIITFPNNAYIKINIYESVA